MVKFVEFAAQKALHWGPPNISDTSLRSINLSGQGKHNIVIFKIIMDYLVFGMQMIQTTNKSVKYTQPINTSSRLFYCF